MTSTNWTASASMTMACVPGWVAAWRSALRTVSAVAKNKPPSTRSITTPGTERPQFDELDERGDHHGSERRLGGSSKSPVKKSSVTTGSAAITSDETGVWAPAEAFTAVFDKLLLRPSRC